MRSLLLFVALLSMAASASAQSAPRSNPTDPRAPVLPPPSQSPFSDYQPFVEQKNSWKEVNQEVAESAAMASMHHKPGPTTSGMDPKAADAPKAREGHAGHDMGSMKDKPGKTMPGMDRQAAPSPKSKEGAAGHHHSDKPAAAAPKSNEGHDAIAMAKPQAAPGHLANVQTARITGTGSVQLIDKVNGRVKLTHDPIAAMGWPKMTLFFRLKEASLADQVKEGDRVEFSLERSASGYVISGFKKPISGSSPARKSASHSGH